MPTPTTRTATTPVACQRRPILLRNLASDAHRAGITTLVSNAIIESDGRVLLLEDPHLDFDDLHAWRLPTYQVHPGETLLDAPEHGLATEGTGLDVDEVTGYLGYYDDPDGTQLVRFFGFTAVMTNPHSVCRNSRTAHYWAAHEDTPAITDQVRDLLAAYFASPLPSRPTPKPA